MAVTGWICLIGFIFIYAIGDLLYFNKKGSKALRWLGVGLGSLVILGVGLIILLVTPENSLYAGSEGESELVEAGEAELVEAGEAELVEGETELLGVNEASDDSEEGEIEKVEREFDKNLEDEVEEGLSEAFETFNSTYYTQYNNYNELISSNFQLVAEGMYTQNLIDDLITWTNEFNELLDVYEKKAKPINEIDKQLFSITNEMISNQRNANSNIIQGLKNQNNQTLIAASSYIETAAELYLKGYRYLE